MATKKVDPFAKGKRPSIDPLGRIQEEGFLGYRTTEGDEKEESVQQVEQSLPPWLAHFQMLSIDRIRKGRFQQRRPEAFDQEKYAQLEKQMRIDLEQGTLRLQLYVMPDPEDETFFVPARGGHRRVEIAVNLGITELLCEVIPYNAEELARGTLFENDGRQDLTIVEKGQTYLLLMHDFGLTQQEVADQYHVPGGRDYVARCISAAEADPDIQVMIFADPERSMRAVVYLSQLSGRPNAVAERAPIIQAFLEGILTVDGIKIAVEQVKRGIPFVLEENRAGTLSPKTVTRLQHAIATHKTMDRWFNAIGQSQLTQAERTELEQLQERIAAMLNQ